MIDWQRVRHFSRDEFGYHGGIEPDPELVRMLDDARHFADLPFTINSGIRSPERNAEVGGVDSSAHLTGHAVDIRCVTSRGRYLMVMALLDAGFDRIGVADTFIHVDTAPNKPKAVLWTYD